MTVRRFDVVVAGGGLVGMAIAWGMLPTWKMPCVKSWPA